MDIAEHFGDEDAEESQTKQEPSKKHSPSTATLSACDATGGCFDCNICLDFAQDPVVTLCGHLYCWPCIYKWLSHRGATPQQCPVCKAALSQAMMVPLYGRGHESSRTTDGDLHSAACLDIPHRPSAYRPQQSAPIHHLQHHGQSPLRREYQIESQYNQPSVLNFGGTARVFHPTTGFVGGTAIAVLPWVLGYPEGRLYYSNPYNSVASANSPRLRRQQMQAQRSLGRISTFLFCCMILCLLLF
ncbi:hypothetical protein ACLOJK_036283 [Asimina triloba]